LIELGESVTWRAKHLGVYQKLTVTITQFDRPHLFADKMLKGAFDSMDHVHQFEPIEETTKMIDVFTFHAPFGILGKLAEILFLKTYMTRFLIKRNEEIKAVVEADRRKEILKT
jgi:ligand-binding SRPBCC domain-containing protein